MLWPFLASLPSSRLLALHLVVTCLSLCPCADCRPGALPADTQRLPPHPGHSLWSAGRRHAHLPAPAADLHAAWLPGELSASSHLDAATAVRVVHTLPFMLRCVICQSADTKTILLTHTAHCTDSKTKSYTYIQHTAQTQKQSLTHTYITLHRLKNKVLHIQHTAQTQKQSLTHTAHCTDSKTKSYTYSTLHRLKNKVLHIQHTVQTQKQSLTHTAHCTDSKTKSYTYSTLHRLKNKVLHIQHTAQTQKQSLAQAYDTAHRHQHKE